MVASYTGLVECFMGVVGTRRRAPSECIRGLWMVDSLIKWINVAIYSEWLSSFGTHKSLYHIKVYLYSSGYLIFACLLFYLLFQIVSFFVMFVL
jgi:hypothetical protein